MDRSTDRIFAGGLRAALEWVRINGYIVFSGSLEKIDPPPAILAIKGGISIADAETILIVDVITTQTLFTADSKNCMFRAIEWKKKHKNTTTVLFVPTGLMTSAKETLGLYDTLIEY